MVLPIAFAGSYPEFVYNDLLMNFCIAHVLDGAALMCVKHWLAVS